MEFQWHCPYCNRDTTIVGSNYHFDYTLMKIKNVDGDKKLISKFIVCPNPECNKFALTVFLFDYEWNAKKDEWTHTNLVNFWNLIPQSEAKVFPTYIPKAIRNDYLEACSIRDLSPKASATLSRRCLQGIIRDFWGVKKKRLVDEIEAIQDKIDPLTWKAINAVRKIGNIGAHMEKDINLIINVEPEEASKLIQLIELLVLEWYINRHEREKNLQDLVGIGQKKEKKKNQ